MSDPCLVPRVRIFPQESVFLCLQGLQAAVGTMQRERGGRYCVPEFPVTLEAAP